MKTPWQLPASGALLGFMLACSDSPIAPSGTALLLPSFNSAGAGPPVTASGTYQVGDFELISRRAAGPNTIFEGLLTVVYEGPLQGTVVQRNDVVCRPTGACVWQVTAGNFTGTVAGCDDVDSFTYRGTVFAQNGPELTAEGSFTIIASKPAKGVVFAGGWTVSQLGLGGTYDTKYICK